MSNEVTSSSPTTGSSASMGMPVVRQTTADDLLAMYDAEESSSKEEVSREVAKQAKVAEELPKKIVADKLAKSLQQRESSIPSDSDNLEESENEESSEEESSEEGSKEQQEEVKELLKAFKAKFNDRELEIPEEAIIPVKVGNKDVSLKIKDAVQAFVKQDEFNRNMDRRFSAVDRREKDLQSEYGQIKEKAEAVVRMASQGDFVTGIRALAKMAGLGSDSDQVELERAMMDQLENIRKVWGEMSPQQREVYFANRKAEELQKELERQKGKSEQFAQRRQIEERIGTVMTQHSISQDQFRQYLDVLANEAVGEGKPFADVTEITPEDIGKYHVAYVTAGKVKQALTNIDPLHVEQPIYDELLELVKDENFTVEEIEDIARQTLSNPKPNKAVENLNRKVELAKSKGLNTQLKQVSSTKKAEESDEMYEHFFGKRKLSPFNR